MNNDLAIPADVVDRNDRDISHASDSEAERRQIERAITDPAAFVHLYRLHAPAIANYLQRRTGDAHVAEDLLSETFLAAMRALPRFRHNGTPLRFWLYRLATNAANRWARTRSRTINRERRIAVAHDAKAAISPASRDPAIEATNALMALSPKLQAVLALHVIEELTLEQISLVLDCRVGTIKSRLFRAREALRSELQHRRERDASNTQTKGLS